MSCPRPDGPTSAIVSPGAMSSDIPRITGSPDFGYVNHTFSNVTAPSAVARETVAFGARSANSGSSSSTSRIRSNPAKLFCTAVALDTSASSGPSSISRYALNIITSPMVSVPLSTRYPP